MAVADHLMADHLDEGGESDQPDHDGQDGQDGQASRPVQVDGFSGAGEERNGDGRQERDEGQDEQRDVRQVVVLISTLQVTKIMMTRAATGMASASAICRVESSCSATAVAAIRKPAPTAAIAPKIGRCAFRQA